MKLHHSGTSPYVRKVMVCAIARGLDRRIELLETNPHASPPALLADNPLSKVPCLVTDEGLALFDSPVICEYLDSLGDASRLFPPPGEARWRALQLQALGDGIMDACVSRRMDGMRPHEAAREAAMARQKEAVARGLDALERDPPGEGLQDIGAVTAACALGYMDFRFEADAWREGRPRLAAWYAAAAERPEMARTALPPQ